MARISKGNRFRAELLEFRRKARRDSYQKRLEESRVLCYWFENGQCPDEKCRKQFVLEHLQWSREYGNYYCKGCNVDWEKKYRLAVKFLRRSG